MLQSCTKLSIWSCTTVVGGQTIPDIKKSEEFPYSRFLSRARKLHLIKKLISLPICLSTKRHSRSSFDTKGRGCLPSSNSGWYDVTGDILHFDNIRLNQNAQFWRPSCAWSQRFVTVDYVNHLLARSGLIATILIREVLAIEICLFRCVGSNIRGTGPDTKSLFKKLCLYLLELLCRVLLPSDWHILTHWGRVAHICVSKLTIVDSILENCYFEP